MVKPDDYIVVMSTVSSRHEAGRIGEELTNRKLAACVNVISGVTSYYRWEGTPQVGEELVLLIKTRSSNYEKVERVIKELHSYDLPEIVALPIVTGDEPYLKWIDERTKSE
jgi:periplasmic divalent cation tolerance protein